MFNVWIVGALLLLLLFVLATFGRGEEHREDEYSRRRLPMKLDAQNEVEKGVVDLAEEKKDLQIDDAPHQ